MDTHVPKGRLTPTGLQNKVLNQQISELENNNRCNSDSQTLRPACPRSFGITEIRIWRVSEVHMRC